MMAVEERIGARDVLESERLRLRRLGRGDAAFVLRLVNDPDWRRYIGDRGVRTLGDAERYIDSGPVAMYERHGFGLLAVEKKDEPAPIGICGLLKRETLPDVDIGFAFLPEFRGRGYALEAARATLAWARDVLRLPRVIAITVPENARSRALLEKIGLRYEHTTILPDGAAAAVFGVTWPGREPAGTKSGKSEGTESV
jgi:RimJ/RimL family protein N-acetyltransferase